MKITAKTSVYFFIPETDVEWEEDVVVDIDYYLGTNKLITSASVEPNDPQEIEVTDIKPVGGVEWSKEYKKAINEQFNKQFDDDDLWDIVENYL